MIVVILAISLFAGRAQAGDCSIDYIEVFHRYVALNNKFLQAVDAGDMAWAERKIVEGYVDNIVDPTLEKLRQEICVTHKCKDRHVDILFEMLKMLIATSNSANELPTYILGEIYVCQPHLLIEAYGKLPLNDRVEIWKRIDLGLRYSGCDPDSNSPMCKEFSTKLFEIRPRCH